MKIERTTYEKGHFHNRSSWGRKTEKMKQKTDLDQAATQLLKNIKTNYFGLCSVLNYINKEWQSEDLTYRFYHNSFKVYRIQDLTASILIQLRAINPKLDLFACTCGGEFSRIHNKSRGCKKHGDPDNFKLNDWFEKIIADGTGKLFESAHNVTWLETTRPMLEAFFHAKYFLEMIVKYGTEDKIPQTLPSGLAAVLYLYNIR